MHKLRRAWHELWVLLTSYRDILAAAVGFGLLIMAAVASYRHVRRKIKYETWWVIHLYVYLGLALALAHQIFTGIAFIGHPLVRTLWLLVAGDGRNGSRSSRPEPSWSTAAAAQLLPTCTRRR